MFDQKRQYPYFGDQTYVDSDNTSKRTRKEEVPESPVLHIRSLPLDITEKEVLALGIPFGCISNALVTKNGQALLEFQDQEHAGAMFNYYSLNSPPVIRGTQPIIIQYSKHPHLSVTSRSSLTGAIEDANKQNVALTQAESRQRVLKLQIDQPTITPVGYLTFYQIVSKFGNVLRIVTFKSGSSPQAFIEFDDQTSADVAKYQLDGWPFAGVGICRTSYSRRNTLDVHSESQFCRDFTANPLTLAQSPQSSMESATGNNVPPSIMSIMEDLHASAGSPPNNQSYHQSSVMSTGPVGLGMSSGATNLPTARELISLDIPTLSAFANEVIRALVLVASSQSGYGVDQQSQQQLQFQATSIRQLLPLNSNSAGTKTMVQQLAANSMMDSALPGVASSLSLLSPVVLVTQLNPEKITPNTLFTLFGVFGDVQRVKILYNKKDTALVQYADGNQASLALQHLNGVPLLGGQIRCHRSKYNNIIMASEGGGPHLAEDFTGSRLHRFRSANSRNHQNICAPNSVLHISGLTDDVTEEDMKQLCENTAEQTPTGVKILESEKKMALVEFASLADAIDALVKLDAFQMKPTSRIRVTFSKCPMNRDVPAT